MKPKKSYISYGAKRTVIVASIVIALALLYFFQSASFILRTFSTIGFIVLFYIIDHMFDLEFKFHHYLFIFLIAIFSFLLSPLYFIYPQYDKIQHFLEPIMFSSIIFYMVSKLRLKLKWEITFTFFIIMASIGLFEIGEYILDYFFDWKLQGVFVRDFQGLGKFGLIQDPHNDTMIDMMFGILGAGLYAISMALFCKKKP